MVRIIVLLVEKADILLNFYVKIKITVLKICTKIYFKIKSTGLVMCLKITLK